MGEEPAGASIGADLVQDGQEAGENTTQNAADAEAEARASLAQALAELAASIEAKAAEIEARQGELREAEDETAEKQLQQKLEVLHGESKELEARFSRIAAAADESLFTDESEPAFDPQEKLLGFLKPVFDEVEELTANSREINRLEQALDIYSRRAIEAATAVANVEAILGGELDASLRQRVTAELGLWTARRDDAEAQVTSIEYELESRRAAQKPFLDATGEFLTGFLRTRGFHLVLGIAAFASIFAIFGGLRSAALRLRRGSSERQLGDRVAALVFRGVTIAAAIGALLFTFQITGDWFLLGITLAFLLAAGWVALKALPTFVDQISLVLNMGAVREGEVVIFDDVPWRVDVLAFRAVLVNDRLSGGRLELPVRELLGLHSRPLGKGEELFPCRAGDWVRLADETVARVDYQTPSVVQVVLLGGSQKTYPTPLFLEQTPANMSTNYRVEFTFGVDYRHQRDCTRKIPELMERRLAEGLTEVVDADDLLNVEVEFKEAAASSLDYEIQIDVRGRAAARYEDVERAAARLLVEACNDNDWVIPFAQLTLHRAPGDTGA